jgi:hypothetical protein
MVEYAFTPSSGDIGANRPKLKAARISAWLAFCPRVKFGRFHTLSAAPCGADAVSCRDAAFEASCR